MRASDLASGRRRITGRGIAGAVALVAAVLGAVMPARASGSAVYPVDTSIELAPGIEYQRLVEDEGPVVAHVVRLEPQPSLQLRSMLSNDRIAGPPPTTERTSAMCRRVNCVVGINGDFYHSTGEPVGAVGRAGRILRSPDPNHNQVSVASSGSLVAGKLEWSARIIAPDLTSLDAQAVNRQPAAGGVTLYTPEYAPSTPADSPATEIVVRVVRAPSLALGETAVVELVRIAEGGGTSIPADGAVLHGQGAGAQALRALWQRWKQNLLGLPNVFRLETAPAVQESVGGSPILLRQGSVIVQDDGSDLVSRRHPRTLVGWNDRERFFVVIDGRQPGYSIGVTLPQAAALLSHLGATDAINLDGGGSSTLSIGGEVVNRPSDRLVERDGKQLVVSQPSPGDVVLGNVERPVADGLAVVATSLLPIQALPGFADLVSPPPGVSPFDPSEDPASRPPLLTGSSAGSRPGGWGSITVGQTLVTLLAGPLRPLSIRDWLAS